MNGLDKRKSLINVGVSISFKLILLVGSIIVRRFLIRYVGNEINGLNSLYLSIIGFLSVAELGVGGAITFCMYKPIVERNTAKIAALYHWCNYFCRRYCNYANATLFGKRLCISRYQFVFYVFSYVGFRGTVLSVQCKNIFDQCLQG